MDFDAARKRLQTIADHAEEDAIAFDSTPFDRKGVGTNFGNVYAMIQAIALTLVDVLEELDDREVVL